MSSEERLTQRERRHIPTLHFIYSSTDELALDCKRLETMRLNPRAAHRQTYYSLYWVRGGSGTVGIDFVEYPIGPLTLTLLQPGQVFYPQVSTPLHGFALYFPSEFLALELLGAANPFPRLARTEGCLLAPLTIDPEHSLGIDHLLTVITDEFAAARLGRATMVRAALQMLLATVGRLRPVTSGVFSSSLAQAFFELVEQHFYRTPRTSQYARMLGVTPGYLNDVVKEATGQTANSILHERVLLEAKRLLLQTDASVVDIAARLAFSEASYFTRFFRRATGLTPTTFRQGIHEKSRKIREKSLEGCSLFY